MTYQDTVGDKVRVEIGVGQPSLLSASTDPAAAACLDQVTSGGSTPAQTLVVPLALTVVVESSQPATVGVLIGDWSTVDGGGNYPTTTPPFLFAGISGGSPQCGGIYGSEGEANWNSLEPGTAGTWTGAILLTGAVTPNDPTGVGSAIHDLVLPTLGLVSMSGQTPQIAPDFTLTTNVVKCGDSSGMVATDPGAVAHFNCPIYS